MSSEQHLILDFSHIYPEDIEKKYKNLKKIDMSDISSTDMYCSADAETEIRKRLSPYGPNGIHFLDNGNYHYITKFFTDMIKSPFTLVLYDHHSDMQKPLFSQMLSCGSWAGNMLRCNHYLMQVVLVGPEQRTIDEIALDLKQKLVCISMEELKNHTIGQKISQIHTDLPFYISIDKDILDRQWARTNWDQGDMPLSALKDLLSVFIHQNVIGIDICGECSSAEPFQALLKDSEINTLTNRFLYLFLSDLL